MIDFPPELAEHAQAFAAENIPDEALYLDPADPTNYGRETHTHTTVAYGLDPAMDRQRIADVVAGIGKPVRVKLGKISKFEPAKYDVIKVEVDSPDLHALHEVVKALGVPGETYPEYKPHLTLAYVQKGAADHLLGQTPFEGQEFELTSFDYSAPPEPGSPDKHTKYQVKAGLAGSVKAKAWLLSPNGVFHAWPMDYEKDEGKHHGEFLTTPAAKRIWGKEVADVLREVDVKEDMPSDIAGVALRKGWDRGALSADGTVYVDAGSKRSPAAVLALLPSEFLIGKSVTNGVDEVPILEGEDAQTAWAHRKDVRHRVKATTTDAEGSIQEVGKFWLDPAGKRYDLGPDAEHADHLDLPGMGVTFELGEFQPAINQLIDAGWTRGGFSTTETLYIQTNKPVEWVLARIPTAMLFCQYLEVEHGGKTDSVRVQQDEGADDAWARRNDARHRVAAAGGYVTSKFWLSPEGEFTTWGERDRRAGGDGWVEEHDQHFPGGKIKNYLEPQAKGWTSGGHGPGFMYIRLGDGKTTDWVLSKLPYEYLLVPLAQIADSSGRQSIEVWVKEGEDLAQAWARRNDVRHRVAAAYDQKFWVTADGEETSDGRTGLVLVDGEHFGLLPDDYRTDEDGDPQEPQDMLWQAVDNGWVRGTFTGSMLYLTVDGEKSVAEALAKLPAEYLMVYSLVVEWTSGKGNYQSKEIRVLDGEDAQSAWQHRKDTRHRVAAGKWRDAYWVRPDGSLLEVKRTHSETIIEVPKYRAIAEAERGSNYDHPLIAYSLTTYKQAIAEGWARVSARRGFLYIEAADDVAVRRAIKSFPGTGITELTVDMGGDSFEVPVLEGEDVEDAWAHRKDVRHRVAASTGKFWVSPEGDVYFAGQAHYEWVMNNKETIAGHDGGSELIKDIDSAVDTYSDYDAGLGDALEQALLGGGWTRVDSDSIQGAADRLPNMKAFVNEYILKTDRETVLFVNLVDENVEFEGRAMDFMRWDGKPGAQTRKMRGGLTAGISPVVYHATSLQAAASILQSDEFKLSVAQGSDAKNLGVPMPAGKFYYLSTARSRTGGYAKDPYRQAATIEIDGTALANRYSGDAVDYWGPEFRGVDPNKFEKEDRVWAKEATIPDASRYIKAVLAFYDPKVVEDMDKRAVRALAIAAKTKGVPFRLYTDKASYVADNEAKAVPVTDLDLKTPPAESHKSYGPLTEGRLEGLVELFKAPVGSKLTPKADDVRNAIVYSDYNVETFIARAEVDLQNSRKNGRAASLIQSMREAKVPDLRQFVYKVAEKWKVPEAVAASLTRHQAEEAVALAIGEASVSAWETVGEGVFQSEKMEDIVRRTVDKLEHWGAFEAYALDHFGIPFRAHRIFAGADLVFMDRYQALGIPYPDPKTCCKGQCEGTGFIPVKFTEPGPGQTYIVYSEEDEAELRPLWDAAEALEHAEDGWHFVKCPACAGTGKIVAGQGAFEYKDDYEYGLKFWVSPEGKLVQLDQGEGIHIQHILDLLVEEGIFGQVMSEAGVDQDDIQAYEEGGLDGMGELWDAAFDWAFDNGWVRAWKLDDELAIEAPNDEAVTKALKAIAASDSSLLFVKTLVAGDETIPVDEGEDAQTAWAHRNSPRKRVVAAKFSKEQLQKMGYTFSVKTDVKERPHEGVISVSYNGYEVGALGFIWADTPDKAITPFSSWVLEGHQRMGIATVMYDMAEESAGAPMVPSAVRSTDAKKFWSGRNNQSKRVVASADLFEIVYSDKFYEQWKKDSSDGISHFVELFDEDDKTDEAYEARTKELFDQERNRVLDEISDLPAKSTIDLWRMITVKNVEEFMLALSNEQTLGEYTGIGTYWSYREESAQAHWGGRGSEVLLHGQVSSSDVLWDETVRLQMDPDIGDGEDEIRLKAGAPVNIVGVKVDGVEQKMEHPFLLEAKLKAGSANIKFWIDPAGVFHGFGGGPGVSYTKIAHLDWLEENGIQYVETEDSFFGDLPTKGWVRGYVDGGHMALTLDPAAISVETAISRIPMEYRFVKSVSVENPLDENGISEEIGDVDVLDGEDALDAWTHRNDARHRVDGALQASDYDGTQPGTKFWLYPDGKLDKWTDPKVEHEDRQLGGYQDSLCVRGFHSAKELFLDVPDADKVEAILKRLPQEFLFTKSLTVYQYQDGDIEVPVLDGEDALDAWSHRKDVRHRVDGAALNPALDDPEFKDWFAGSKIVDKNGDPLLLMHGTDVSDIERFEGPDDPESAMPGIMFFTTSKATARSYGSVLYSVALKMTNPYVYDAKGKSYVKVSPFWIASDAKAKGHDGVIVKNIKDDMVYRHKGDTYVVWNPDQVWNVGREGEGRVTVKQRKESHEKFKVDMEELTKKNKAEADVKMEKWLKTPEGKKWAQTHASLKARKTGIRFWITPDGELETWESDTFDDPWDETGETSHGFMLYSVFPDFEFDHEEEIARNEDIDVAHIAIKHGYTRGIFANDELNIELGAGKTVSWALSKLPPEYLFVKLFNVEDQGDVLVSDGEDALDAWKHRSDPRHRVAAANQFDRLYRAANEVAQDDAKYSGALENPALAQKQGQFMQNVKDARSEGDLERAWAEFQPSVTWEALTAMAGAQP
jgi:2'-5' RNA ligase/uncharacterized protein (DUF427 family)